MSCRWFIPFTALDPRDLPNGQWDVGLPEWLYRRAQNAGHEKQLARLKLVREVLQGGTTNLYEGWNRPDKDDGCYVYVGEPNRDFKSLQIETPAPKGMLFLVFVLSDGSIDEWTWRPRSEKKNYEDTPDGVQGKLIWSLKLN